MAELNKTLHVAFTVSGENVDKIDVLENLKDLEGVTIDRIDCKLYILSDKAAGLSPKDIRNKVDKKE